jgi:hypothetical protein
MPVQIHYRRRSVINKSLSTMPLNLRFHYLYRDSGNYKKFGHKDYSNPGNLTIEEAEKLLRKYLIDKEFFYPEKVGIPSFRVFAPFYVVIQVFVSLFYCFLVV